MKVRAFFQLYLPAKMIWVMTWADEGGNTTHECETSHLRTPRKVFDFRIHSDLKIYDPVCFLIKAIVTFLISKANVHREITSSSIMRVWIWVKLQSTLISSMYVYHPHPNHSAQLWRSCVAELLVLTYIPNRLCALGPPPSVSPDQNSKRAKISNSGKWRKSIFLQ